MKPTDIKTRTYFDFDVESTDEDPRFKVSDEELMVKKLVEHSIKKLQKTNQTECREEKNKKEKR